MLSILRKRLDRIDYDRILGIESRGFLIGQALALEVEKPFVPLRKKGKLPGDIFRVEYSLEYGQDMLEVQKDALPRGSKCLIVDDLIATGGSMEAAMKLVHQSDCIVAGFACIIELKSLNARALKLGNHDVITLFQY